MSSQTSEPIEKSQKRLKNVLQIALIMSIALIIAVVAIILLFSYEKVSKQMLTDGNFLILVIFSILSIVFILCIRSKAKISLCSFSSKGISAKFIFHAILACILGSIYSLNNLLEIVDETTKEMKFQQKIINDITFEIDNLKDGINSDLEVIKNTISSDLKATKGEIDLELKNIKDKLHQNQKNSSTKNPPCKEQKNQPKQTYTATEEEVKPTEETNTSPTAIANNNISPTVVTNTVNEPKDNSILINILKIMMVSFLALLSSHLFLVKDKIDDYLDSLDEDNQNQETKPQPQPEQPLN